MFIHKFVNANQPTDTALSTYNNEFQNSCVSRHHTV